MGLVPPARAQVTSRPRHRPASSRYRIARLGLGYVPEDRRIFTELTVIENLEVGRRPPRAGAPAWTQDKLFALFPNLAPHARPPRRPDVGRRAADAHHRAHADGQSAFVLLDEPSEGLAPVIVEQMAT